MGEYQFTVHKGERWSSAKSYLRPAMENKNLTVSTEALVTKILFDGKRAVGVEILNKEGELERVRQIISLRNNYFDHLENGQ